MAKLSAHLKPKHLYTHGRFNDMYGRFNVFFVVPPLIYREGGA
jgi:hypothetical protein